MPEILWTAARGHARVWMASAEYNIYREEWHTFLPESHPAYISWQEYEQNLKRLRESAQAIGFERRKSPPREGPAWLQGLIVCGKCGRRMILRYHARQAGLCPEYVCQRKGIENAEPPCQRIPGAEIDRVLSDMLCPTKRDEGCWPCSPGRSGPRGNSASRLPCPNRHARST